MAVRKIIRMGHPNLRQSADAIDLSLLDSDDFHRLLDDMVDTLHDYGGIGLAAPQIDEPYQLAIIELPGGPSRYGDIQPVPLTCFVNPTLTVLDAQDTAGYWEGCLSVPGLRGYVERPQHVRVDYFDQDGTAQRLTLQGFPATVVQHEFDHLAGRLYIDHIEDRTRIAFEDEFNRYIAPSLDANAILD